MTTHKLETASAMILALVCVVAPSKQCAADYDLLVQEAYRRGESDAKKQLDDFFKGAEVERLRKAKAGEPAATSDQQREALKGIKFMIYNRAATNGICAAQAFKISGSPDAAWGAFKQCVEKRNAEMLKFVKLGDYASLPANRSDINCELRGRDFGNERRFPPFDFVQDGLGPALLDFEVVNSCLLTGR